MRIIADIDESEYAALTKSNIAEVQNGDLANILHAVDQGVEVLSSDDEAFGPDQTNGNKSNKFYKVRCKTDGLFYPSSTAKGGKIWMKSGWAQSLIRKFWNPENYEVVEFEFKETGRTL